MKSTELNSSVESNDDHSDVVPHMLDIDSFIADIFGYFLQILLHSLSPQLRSDVAHHILRSHFIEEAIRG